MAIGEIIEEIVKVITLRAVVITAASSTAAYLIIAEPNKTETVDDSSIEQTATPRKLLNKYRQPSSKFTAADNKTYTPEAKITSYDKDNFVNPDNLESTDTDTDTSTNTRVYSDSRNEQPNTIQLPPALEAQDLPTAKKPSLFDDIFPTGSNKIEAPKDIIKKKEAETESTISSSSSTLPDNITYQNSCTTNIVGGSFGNAISIHIECLYPSAIKYCLSLTEVCCDPTSNGTAYSNQVTIGPANGKYCLSYVGDTASEGSSEIYQNTYTVNSTFPHLSISNPKIFYQTTELIGESFIGSSDFGLPNYSVGLINLKNHDPGPEGLNYDCEEIIANYVTLSTPSPSEILPLFDVSLATPSSQVVIPLRTDELVYGDNFMTSYIKNSNASPELYSCSISKINLEDFEYFQADVSQSEAGTNTVREFEGSFSAYGFFEANNDLYRGPAGESAEVKTGEKLNSGMLSMFY